jgi:putative addiction module component (TIGR02574 family)
LLSDASPSAAERIRFDAVFAIFGTKMRGKAAHCERVSVMHVDPSLFGVATPSVAAKATRHHNGGMSNEIPSIVDAALNLPDLERASLAYRLLQSLKPPKVLSDANSQFESELDRRVEDYEAGRTTASDWEEVASRLQAKLKKRESS